MRAAGWAARVLMASAVAVFTLGMPVVALTSPPVTSVLVARFYDSRTGGLPPAEALAAAERVRVYVTRDDAPPLPVALGGRPAFDATAASHLLDVRRVLRAAVAATLVAGLILATGAAWAAFRRRWGALAWPLGAGALGALVTVVAGGAFASLDFDAFFSAFHGVFFSAGTWTFPRGTLLIELFPEALWATLAAAWGAGIVVLAACCVGGAVLLRAKRHSLEADYVQHL